MKFETIILEKKDSIAFIIFNRPKVFNAYNEQMSRELKVAVDDVCKDDTIRVLVLKGAGSNFLAGADIMMLNSWVKIAKEQGWEKIMEILSNHFSPTLIERMNKPVIGAVDGRAWGMGSEIALACDLLICTTQASFAQPEINIGVITGGGASQRLPRIVGKVKAMEMILTGTPISADDAYQWGLVNKVVAPEELDASVEKLAKAIATKSREMISNSKYCVNLVLDHDLYTGIQKELICFSKMFMSPDAEEGTTAFLEKRKPNYSKQ